MENTIENLKIIHSAEYKRYIQSLCWIAEDYVERIRAQFAVKAFEMYQNETARKIVLAYGEEHEKREQDRLRDFSFASENPDSCWSLKDNCLNHAEHYAQTVKMLFGIK
jgi:hypothetical protein